VISVISGNIRNLAMEKVAATVLFPCRYSNNGCPQTLLHTDKGEHEETCEFR
jgi:E3 ubiquitin-protein ligase SIAH1